MCTISKCFAEKVIDMLEDFYNKPYLSEISQEAGFSGEFHARMCIKLPLFDGTFKKCL